MQNSAEIRWFWRGPVLDEIEQWFRSASFPPGGGKLRRDVYLADSGQVELGIKQRNGTDGVEVKELVGRFPNPLRIGTLLGHGELWTKWSSPSLKLDGLITQTVIKTRWLRKFEVTSGNVREIELGEDEKPRNGEEKLPEQGCNLEYTNVSLAHGGQAWSTIGFESFGDYFSVETNLRLTLEHVENRSLPTFPARRGAQLSGLARSAAEIARGWRQLICPE
ncbi:MAG TPA: hypothetical protein VGG95_10860 [Edaphobacter sp.]